MKRNASGGIVALVFAGVVLWLTNPAIETHQTAIKAYEMPASNPGGLISLPRFDPSEVQYHNCVLFSTMTHDEGGQTLSVGFLGMIFDRTSEP